MTALWVRLAGDCEAVSYPAYALESPVEAGQNRGVDFDSTPQVAESYVFIGAVLVIVVVGDGDADPRETQVIEDVHRNAAALRRRDHGVVARGVLHNLDKRFRGRQIH